MSTRECASPGHTPKMKCFAVKIFRSYPLATLPGASSISQRGLPARMAFQDSCYRVRPPGAKPDHHAAKERQARTTDHTDIDHLQALAQAEKETLHAWQLDPIITTKPHKCYV